MNNIEELVYSAMQSSLEGYATSVVDSIEFELKRELTADEHQQVYAAVDRAITGIEAAQKEIADWRSVAEAAAQDDAEWHKLVDSKSDVISHLASGIINLIARLEAAQKELFDLHNQEFQQRLANAEHQLYMKDLAIHNIKASRMAQFRKRLKAEAALSAANEKLKGGQVPVAIVELNDNLTVAEIRGDIPRRKAVRELYEGALVIGQELFAAAPRPAGFTVDGGVSYEH